MREFLVRANITGFDAGQYIDSHRDNTSALPNIALAFSGGGYRALLNGAGALAAFDSRTPNATNKGHLGGLLQASTYTAALSGGGWMIGSIFANNFTTVQNLIDHSDVWQFQNSLFAGPPTGGIQILSTADYWKNLADTVSSKVDARGGFNTSLTDYYGRGLSFQLINATDGGAAYTFSSIQNDTSFSNGETPMPILVADERAPGDTLISLNATVFEFNPFEMVCLAFFATLMPEASQAELSHNALFLIVKSAAKQLGLSKVFRTLLTWSPCGSVGLLRSHNVRLCAHKVYWKQLF
jgi:lysophospholipase